MKKILIIFLTLILLGMVSCGGGEKESREFIYASNAKFAHFDPHNSFTTPQVNLTAQVYESLTARNESFEIEQGLGLAKSWKLISEKTWEFTLQEGVKFHDGADFTAEDVVATWKRANASTEGSISLAKNIITQVDIVDPYTIIIHTNAYYPVLPEALTSIQIMDKDWIETNAPKAITSKDTEVYTVDRANGTGPYKLVSLLPNTEIIFEKNNDYWNKKNMGRIDTIKYVTIENPATRIASLISGQVDLIFPVPIQDWQRIQENDNVKMITSIEARPIFLGMDQYRDTLMGAEKGATDNPFKDKRVREAINLAIDIQTINEKLLDGNGLPIGILSAPGLGGHPKDKDLTAPYEYNVEKAKQLLVDAGYPDGFSVTFNAPNNRYVKDAEMAEAIKGMLAKINIDVNLVTEPRSEYFARIFTKRETSLYMLGWGPVASSDYDIVTRLISYPDEEKKLGSFNIGKYKNLEVNKYAEQLGNAKYNSDFLTLIEKIYRISKEDFAYIPLLAPPLSLAAKKEYNVYFSPSEEIRFRSITSKDK